MPEQSLTSTEGRNDPVAGPGDGASRRSWRARLEQSAALLAPVALIGGLAVAGGGFDVSDRHIAGLAAWLVVVALLVFGAGSAVKPERPLYWAGGLIVCLSLLCAISSLWSGSAELSVIEADRVAVYLGFFLAAFLIAQTDERRQRFAEGLAIAVALVAMLGIVSRLLPHVLVRRQRAGERAAPQLPARLLERQRGAARHRRCPVALDQPPRDVATAALVLDRSHPGLAVCSLPHLLARRPARPGRRLRLPDRPLPGSALVAGDTGDRSPRCAAGNAGGAGERKLAHNLGEATHGAPGGDRAP